MTAEWTFPWDEPPTPSAAKPYLKWAGGKRGLLSELLPRLPDDFARYHEPFVGGGALFFSLRAAGRLSSGAVISDLNPHLIQAYQAVRAEVEDVIEVLQSHIYERDYYNEVRALDPATLGQAQRAARFIYLNRTCYNGLYRVNRKGQFNVPIGRYKSPTICDADNLRAVSAALRGVEIRCEDFAGVVKRAERGDVVYLDPPYVPLNATANFTGYTSGGFDDGDQRRLAETFRQLAARGVSVVLSNSDTPPVHELYDDALIEQVMARRAINSKGGRRGKISEVIVRPVEAGGASRDVPA